jgi:carboxyl-terminal processing protease
VIVLLVVLVLGGRAVSQGQVGSGVDPNIRLLAEAIAKVRSQYVDEMGTDEIVENAIRGMLSSLDPYSVYLDTDDFTNLRIGTQGNYEGLGIQISIRDGFLTVIAPFEGTPAFRAGIIAGDRIVEIDGQSTESMTLDDAVHLMRGPKGSSVELKVARGRDRRLLDIPVERDVIVLKSVPYAFRDPDGIGYVRVSSFSENTGKDLRRAIENLRDEGIHGLVLDLRGNPGGLLDQAVAVAECFVPSGKMIVETRGRNRRDQRQYNSRSRNVYDELPLVVMIDRGSASASEIVSGAIQDWDLGLVIGKTSFGKASVQTVLTLSDGSAMKLTTAKYYTPSGRSIQRDERREDPRVTAAIDDSGAEMHIDDRELFLTSMGREIRGGGGIAPDVEIDGVEYPDLMYDILRAGLLGEFSRDLLSRHSDWRPPAALPAGEVERFATFMRDVGEIDFTDDAFEEARDLIELGIRRETVRLAETDLAAWKVHLEGDLQYQEARDLLQEAGTLEKMFELADSRRAIEVSH